MKKSIIYQMKWLLLIWVLLGGLFGLAGCSKNKNIIETFPKKITDLDSYKLVARLESVFPTGTKECGITTYYLKPDLYRVEIESQNLQDKQIILKNSEGVYVLIPSINKSFKIRSTWPINSSYPYLLQSLSKDIVSDENIVTTRNDGTTTLELKAKLFDDAMPSSQKIIFDNETALPKEVLTYDKNKNLVSRLIIDSIELNPNLSKDLFNKDKTMEAIRLLLAEETIEFDRVISYPTYYPEGSSLLEEVIRGGSLNRRAMMKFGGEVAYTIAEEFQAVNFDEQTLYLDGDIFIMGGVATIISNDVIFFFDNGVEYTVASTALDTLEMVRMADSLRIIREK